MNTALIVVDVQNDFCEGGALAVAGGAHVAGAISAYLAENRRHYVAVAATRDWHSPLPDTNDGHFAADGADPDYVTTWPVHCVANTPGADYHPDLKLPGRTVHVLKGESRQDYSGFQGRTLATGWADQYLDLDSTLRAAFVDRIDIVGLATDHCVTATALDGIKAGYQVRVLTDLTAAVAAPTTVTAMTRLARARVELLSSHEAWSW